MNKSKMQSVKICVYKYLFYCKEKGMPVVGLQITTGAILYFIWNPEIPLKYEYSIFKFR